MASYNLNPSNSTTNKTAVTQNTSKSPAQEVIEPTYTPIDWENKIEQTRENTIRECMQQTKKLIDSSEKKQQEKLQDLEKTIISNQNDTNNTMAKVLVMLNNMQQHMEENTKSLRSSIQDCMLSPQESTMVSQTALIKTPNKSMQTTPNEKKRDVDQSTQVISQSLEKKIVIKNNQHPTDTPIKNTPHNESDV